MFSRQDRGYPLLLVFGCFCHFCPSSCICHCFHDCIRILGSGSLAQRMLQNFWFLAVNRASRVVVLVDYHTFQRRAGENTALLPRRIDGYWALIHPPMTALGAQMWISYSPDLRDRGRHRLMTAARRGAWWDVKKIGLSPPLIETSRGCLVLYHGVRHTPSGCLYRLGWPCSSLRNQRRACCAAIRGSLGLRPSTNVVVTSIMLCFLVGIR